MHLVTHLLLMMQNKMTYFGRTEVSYPWIMVTMSHVFVVYMLFPHAIYSAQWAILSGDRSG